MAMMVMCFLLAKKLQASQVGCDACNASGVCFCSIQAFEHRTALFHNMLGRSKSMRRDVCTAPVACYKYMLRLLVGACLCRASVIGHGHGQHEILAAWTCAATPAYFGCITNRCQPAVHFVYSRKHENKRICNLFHSSAAAELVNMTTAIYAMPSQLGTCTQGNSGVDTAGEGSFSHAVPHASTFVPVQFPVPTLPHRQRRLP